MRELNNTEIQDVSGGIIATFSSISSGISDYGFQNTLFNSILLDTTLFTIGGAFIGSFGLAAGPAVLVTIPIGAMTGAAVGSFAGVVETMIGYPIGKIISFPFKLF